MLAYLPYEWTSKSIAGAPTQARELAETTGGVRPDQRLYTMDQLGRIVAFGLWWPWGDEITISLRIGLGGYVGEHTRPVTGRLSVAQGREKAHRRPAVSFFLSRT